MKIADIIIGDRHRKDLGDLPSLAGSIRDRGLLHPPVVTSGNELVCGFRRLKAAESLGWPEIDVRVIDPDELLLAECDENQCRKEFTRSERVGIARAIEELIGLRQGQRTDRGELPPNCAEVEPGIETREVIAGRAGFDSREDLRRTAVVVDEGVPDLVALMDTGEVSVSAAAVVATLTAAEQRKVVAKGAKAVKEKAKEIREKNKGSRSSGVAAAAPCSDRTITAALLKDHVKTDAELAVEVGATETRVAALRKSLEDAGRIPRKPAQTDNASREAAAAKLGDDGDDGAGLIVTYASPDKCRDVAGLMQRTLGKYQEHVSGLMAHAEFAPAIRNVAKSYGIDLYTDGSIQGKDAYGSVRYGVAKYTCEQIENLFGFIGGLKLMFDRLDAKPVGASADQPTDAQAFGESLRGEPDDVEI